MNNGVVAFLFLRFHSLFRQWLVRGADRDLIYSNT